MAARLTDKQKKRIIADYLELDSYNAVAKIHGVSRQTVKNVVQSNPENRQKLQEKKERNTLDMLAFMDSRKNQAQSVIDKYIKALADPEKLEKATIAQIATAMGIVVDKFTNTTTSGADTMQKLDGLLKEFQDAVKSETD